MRFEYNHFTILGDESMAAAIASECAREQGQFWPYHDVIFANQLGENRGAFSKAALKAFAGALALDRAEFNACLDAGRYEDVVQAETAAGRERGVQSTPTLFVNGEMIEGAAPFDELQSRIEAILSETGGR